MLEHGLAGFDELFGVYEYWFGIPDALRDGGAAVFVTEVSQLNSTEARGEQLIDQIEQIVAITGKPKVNLIGHSHGGLDVRYVAAVRPDLVASVTSGRQPAQRRRARRLPARQRQQRLVHRERGRLLRQFARHGARPAVRPRTNPQDAVGALDSLTSAGLATFNAHYPQGVPATACGGGASTVNGIRYYSWSGTGVLHQRARRLRRGPRRLVAGLHRKPTTDSSAAAARISAA